MYTAIKVEMLEAIKVIFLSPFFEDDFPERGMKAWLTKILWDKKSCCYELFFDFSDFERENEKYFTETFYPNDVTKKSGIEKNLYTAKEAGYYNSKYSVFFSPSASETRDDVSFEKEIKKYLVVSE